MADPEVHNQSALYEQDSGNRPHAQRWRAHTRDIVTDPETNVIDITKRSRERIEAQLPERWGQPIAEPAGDPRRDSDGASASLVDGLNRLHLWRDPTPSLKAYWRDLKDGGARVYETSGLPLSTAYWLLGAPGFIIVAVCKTVETIAGRPGSLAGSLLVLLLIWGALTLAGLNPI